MKFTDEKKLATNRQTNGPTGRPTSLVDASKNKVCKGSMMRHLDGKDKPQQTKMVYRAMIVIVWAVCTGYRIQDTGIFHLDSRIRQNNNTKYEVIRGQ